MRPRSRRRRVIALTACAAVLVLVVAGFAIDQARHDGTVARNVALDGTLIGGATDAELQDAVHDTAEAWAAVPVTVETPAGPFDTTLGDLGVTLDEEAVAAAARSEGRDGGWLAELWSWLRSPLGHREVALTFDADTASAAAALASAEAANHRDPTEPTLAPGADAITVVPGADGATLDTGAVAQQALDAARRGERTITIAAATVPLPPDVSEARAAELATQANALADQPLGIYLDNKSGRFDADMIRSWFRPAIVDGALEVTIDPAAARDDITGVLGQVGVAPQQLRFEVDPEGKVVIVDGVAGTECCTPESLQGIVSALEAGDERVDLTLASVAPDHDRAWAEQLGITTPIATFTTQHPCCAPRGEHPPVRRPDPGHGHPPRRDDERQRHRRATHQGARLRRGAGDRGRRVRRGRRRWGQPVRRDPVQRRILRRPRHPRVPVAQHLHRSLPVRRRIDDLVGWPRPEDPQQHADRRADLADLRRHVDHGHPLRHPVDGGHGQEPIGVARRRVHRVHTVREADPAGQQPDLDRRLLRPLPTSEGVTC
ncbi:MAG: peptidoglycan binding domain-containing protein [Acidimicrobiales bacterium]